MNHWVTRHRIKNNGFKITVSLDRLNAKELPNLI